MKAKRAWTDDLGQTFTEREDGRVICEYRGEANILGPLWIGDDFDHSPHYRRLPATPTEEAP